jgi:predicted amidohydrolase
MQQIVACAQMRTTPDVAANLDAVDRLTARAAARGAGTVLFPEAFAFLGPDAGKQAILEDLPAVGSDGRGGPILAHCQAAARTHGVHLVLGGFHERSPTPGKAWNTCVHLAPDGRVLARYRKIHMFDVALADGTRLEESARTLRGEEAVVTDAPFGRLGLTVCYDLRFPRLFERLVDAGAIALTVPSAFTLSTGKEHWHVLLRARAIECQSYVLAPAQYGAHHGTRVSYGHALIVDPWGCVIAECGDGEGLAIAEIDPARVAQVRRELPSLQHRVPF